MMSDISRYTLAIAAAVLVALAAPATGRAGTVSDSSIPCEKGNQCTTVAFAAAPGEANNLVISNFPSLSRRGVRLRDTGAPISVTGTACHAVDPLTVECTDVYSLEVETGDGNDRVLGPDLYDSISLGPGNDVGVSNSLSGAAGDDLLTGSLLDGGAGNDTLIASNSMDSTLDGGSGADTLIGGPKDDTLVASDVDTPAATQPAAPDRLDGGPGSNTVSYRGTNRDVVVDLAAGGGQGAPGEGDTLVNVQNIDGGEGDDRLRGDAGPNVLFGDLGADRLAGRAGDDHLIGDGGLDTFAGGDGDDTLESSSVDGTYRADVGRERLDCGAGADVIAAVDRDVIDASCERLASLPDDVAINPFPRMGQARAAFRLPCPVLLRTNGRCRGRLTFTNLSSKSKRASSTRPFKLRAAGATVRLKLSRGTRVRIPLRKSATLAIRIRYGVDGTELNYRIKLPKGCKQPTRC